MLRLHYLQHVPFEGPANINTWARDRGHRVSRTPLFEGEPVPTPGDFDWLVVMGGPMNVYEEDKYPWLTAEKKLIEKAIAAGKIVLGICLGAQLIADVLGGRVYRNAFKEIGWHPVSLTPEAVNSPFFANLPDRFTAFHWHGDTFDLPAGCRRTAETEACRNQAFEYNGRVIGLQFHLESSTDSITQLIENCADELVEGKYIQPAEAILSRRDHLSTLNATLRIALANLDRQSPAQG